jgi:hypothetical protein
MDMSKIMEDQDEGVVYRAPGKKNLITCWRLFIKHDKKNRDNPITYENFRAIMTNSTTIKDMQERHEREKGQKISRYAMTEALEELVKEGHAEKQPGAGTKPAIYFLMGEEPDVKEAKPGEGVMFRYTPIGSEQKIDVLILKS